MKYIKQPQCNYNLHLWPNLGRSNASNLMSAIGSLWIFRMPTGTSPFVVIKLTSDWQSKTIQTLTISILPLVNISALVKKTLAINVLMLINKGVYSLEDVLWCKICKYLILNRIKISLSKGKHCRSFAWKNLILLIFSKTTTSSTWLVIP